MLRSMPLSRDDKADRAHSLARERQLQTGAALVLGLTVLIAIVLRAGVHNVFPVGWWRL